MQGALCHTCLLSVPSTMMKRGMEGLRLFLGVWDVAPAPESKLGFLRALFVADLFWGGPPFFRVP